MIIVVKLLIMIPFVSAFRRVAPRFVYTDRFIVPIVSFRGLKTIKNTGRIEKSFMAAQNSNLQDVELNDELKSSFMSYSMSTILSRALPDARDGLKPVHRRVLYAMNMLNLGPDTPFRKSARIVGEVLGKYHPHGDQSVYDALVRMAQPFVMNHRLVLGHGNFGSIDNDPAAAMRYTEAKLSSMANDALLADIKDDTVDFSPNFDGNEMEPVVFPARIPILLLNGAQGIAVGMATNIPPHNLGELLSGVLAVIRNPNLSDEELFEIIPAPDFPTGGIILGGNGTQDLYRTGHGSISVRAKTHIETLSSQLKNASRSVKEAIIVTELPYMTVKSDLISDIALLIEEKKLDGISDIRDESDRNGIRIVLELKKDAISNVVENNLFAQTAMQVKFSGNMVALVNDGKKPERINLKRALELFVDFRFRTIDRRTRHYLLKFEERLHILSGVVIAISSLNETIDAIKSSNDVGEVRAKLMSPAFGLSSIQADAVLNLKLSRLTTIETSKLLDEKSEIEKSISDLKLLLSDPAKIYNLMEEETIEIMNKYAISRRTEILSDVKTVENKDLIPNGRSIVVMTSSGYIKRMPIDEFESQNRGSRGKLGANIKSDLLTNSSDSVMHFLSCRDHDTMLFVTNRGYAYSMPAFKIPLSSRTSRGTPITQLLSFKDGETNTAMFSFDENISNKSCIMLTKCGRVKKLHVADIKGKSKLRRGTKVVGLLSGDSLSWARLSEETEDVLIATRKGYAVRFPVSKIREQKGKGSHGVKGITLRKDDEVVDMDMIPADTIATTKESDNNISNPGNMTSDGYVIAVTSRGFGKRLSISDIKSHGRGLSGVRVIKFSKAALGNSKEGSVIKKRKSRENDSLQCLRVCSSDDTFAISTRLGIIVHQRVSDISMKSRTAIGSLVQNVREEDSVSIVDIIKKSEQ